MKPPVWLINLLLGVLLFAAVLAAFYFYGHEMYEQGETAERAEWQQRENDELTVANARIVELENQYRALEQRRAADMAKASADYQESLQHEKANHDRVVADLRSGALRLRVALARRETAAGGAAAEAQSAAGRCDGEARAELSGEAAEFLVGLANEADAVVHQLAACQAVVIADRRE